MLRLQVMVGVLSGCAATAPLATPARPPEPACSFRSATSCYRIKMRLPPRPPEPTDSQPVRPFTRPAAVFANAADSTGRAP